MSNQWTVIDIDAGECVLCDFCNDDYTTSNETGGILFLSDAVCPKCTPSTLASAEEFGELEYVRARCPDNQSFADFVRQYRKRT